MQQIVLDGAFLTGTAPPVFRRIVAPTQPELQALAEQIAERIGRALERDGLITRDCENTYLSFDPAEGPGSALRAAVTPSGRGQGSLKQSKAQDEEGKRR